MKKFILALTVLGLLPISRPSFAQTMDLNSRPIWSAQAMAYVKTLSRPIDIYTWEPRANWGSREGEIVQPKDQRAYALMQSYAKSFADPKEALVYEGPNGAYFATDPFVSREWGVRSRLPLYNSKEWSMIRVTVPKGTRFLDGRSRTGPLFQKELQQFVSSKGCSATTMRELLNVKSRTDSRQCWSAYVEIVKETKIYLLAKEFFALAPDYCVNHNTAITDFIVVDPDMDSIDKGVMKNFAVFVAEIPTPDTAAEERNFIQDYWKLAKQAVAARYGTQAGAWASRWSPLGNFFMTSPYQFSLPWDLPPTDLSSPLLKQKIEEKIFGCGTYSEDRP